ncbi:MAG: fdrA domain protein [Tissierellia bacterium]|jgi:FdrA protein|nr:fdrA domain protein [Tissierellia bacterium]
MKLNNLFKSELKVLNIGLEGFYNDLKQQKTDTVWLNWKPRSSSNKKSMSLLDKLRKK